MFPVKLVPNFGYGPVDLFVDTGGDKLSYYIIPRALHWPFLLSQVVGSFRPLLVIHVMGASCGILMAVQNEAHS